MHNQSHYGLGLFQVYTGPSTQGLPLPLPGSINLNYVLSRSLLCQTVHDADLDKLHAPVPCIVKHAIFLYGINGGVGCCTAQNAATICATLQAHMQSMAGLVTHCCSQGSTWQPECQCCCTAQNAASVCATLQAHTQSMARARAPLVYPGPPKAHAYRRRLFCFSLQSMAELATPCCCSLGTKWHQSWNSCNQSQVSSEAARHVLHTAVDPSGLVLGHPCLSLR